MDEVRARILEISCEFMKLSLELDHDTPEWKVVSGIDNLLCQYLYDRGEYATHCRRGALWSFIDQKAEKERT